MRKYLESYKGKRKVIILMVMKIVIVLVITIIIRVNKYHKNSLKSYYKKIEK